ncbi:MAG: helix-turn-helix transcriptional regulator [Chitinophagaceae bacterium]|jgi:AraC-like DNA-binding protein|nr:helix-turn-helix transcriptional regulator [Chitinophagaceae bacterium]
MKPPKIQSNREKALTVQQYILDNLEDPRLGGLRELSERFYITAKTLNRVFKKEFHHTIPQFIKERRLQQAYKLLSQEGKQVQEVAILIGYTTADSFSKAFKKKFSQLPGSLKRIP